MKPISKYLFALSQFFMIWAATISFQKGEVFLGILDLSSFVVLTLATFLSWKTFTNTQFTITRPGVSALLIATTVAAVVLGIAVWALRK